MFVPQRLIGIPKVSQSLMHHDRSINKHWIDDLHFNFLCCVFYFIKVHTLDLESRAFWLNLWGAAKRLSKIEHNNTCFFVALKLPNHKHACILHLVILRVGG